MSDPRSNGPLLPIPPSAVPRGRKPNARRLETRLEPHRTSHAPGRCTERSARPHRRCGFRQSQHVRGSDPDTGLHADGRSGPQVRTRFHVTALCSPTRAALLTGRNNHAVGFGSVSEFAGGFPGSSASLPRDCAPSPRILRDNGYSTAVFGKWAPWHARRAAGPGGPVRPLAERAGIRLLLPAPGRRDSGQWDRLLDRESGEGDRDPGGILRRRRRPLLLPRRDGGQDHQVDPRECRARIRKSRSSRISRPAVVTRHITSPRRGQKSKDKFDQGWDKLREETFARQKALGVVPADAEAHTTCADAFPARDDVPDTLKAFYARQMEVYAGFSENADHNVGRVIDAIEELGELDNTVIIWIWGDNGASMEGTVTGSVQRDDDADRHSARPTRCSCSSLNASAAWTSGGPRSWTRTTAPRGHQGQGTPPSNGASRSARYALGHAQPDGRPVAGTHHRYRCFAGAHGSAYVIDVAPTILDLAGIPQPRTVDGIEQEPMHGTSIAATFADAQRAPVPDAAILRDDREPRHVQRWLVAHDEDRTDPLGRHARGA